MDITKIRNFSIIAHIDHGKSTLADRILLYTGAITQREFREQILDDMDLERERGITIKARAVRIRYKDYELNLIDTPGHVDFTYEVSKSLAACEGVILLVDASQGIEAQTISNLYLALERDLTIIPVMSKTDLQHADPDKVRKEIVNILGCAEDEILKCSAKTGEGIEDVVQAILDRIPAPKSEENSPLKCLVFDSVFESYRGVITYFRVMDGEIKIGDKIRLMGVNKQFEVEQLGIFNPKPQDVTAIGKGSVGFLTAHIRNVSDVRIGDTITHQNSPCEKMLAGYKEPKPMVFCGLYPLNTKDFTSLRDALEKLHLNDSSFVFEPETSHSLGFGFRCGFLGLLHMEIVQQRLEREFDLQLLVTAPNVIYKIIKTNGKEMMLENPTKVPNPSEIASFQEPYIAATIILPSDFLGALMQLCQERRGIYKSTEYIDPTRAMLHYEMPLSEVLIDFYDKLKSLSRGYASFNYDFIGYKESKLVKLDILINAEPVDAFSTIVFKDQAYERGKALAEKLKEVIPRQMFEIAIQAAIGSKIIARESVRAIKKDVTAKCYGGDISRKRKLWDKQKEGKKKMKQVGKVELPPEAFVSVLKIR